MIEERARHEKTVRAIARAGGLGASAVPLKLGMGPGSHVYPSPGVTIHDLAKENRPKGLGMDRGSDDSMS